MAQKDWARWIFASVASYLKEVATDRNLPVLVEHLDERTEAFMQATDRAEIRITGPFTRELSHGCYRAFVDVNVLLTSRYDGAQKDAYSILKHAGAFHEAMDMPIGVWNYGNEPGDYVEGSPETQVFLGCLTPRSGRNDVVRVLNFGQIDPVDKIKQTEVDVFQGDPAIASVVLIQGPIVDLLDAEVLFAENVRSSVLYTSAPARQSARASWGFELMMFSFLQSVPNAT